MAKNCFSKDKYMDEVRKKGKGKGKSDGGKGNGSKGYGKGKGGYGGYNGGGYNGGGKGGGYKGKAGNSDTNSWLDEQHYNEDYRTTGEGWGFSLESDEFTEMPINKCLRSKCCKVGPVCDPVISSNLLPVLLRMMLMLRIHVGLVLANLE